MSLTKRLTTVIIALMFTGISQAQELEFYDFEASKIYAGGGFSYNNLRWNGYDNAPGIQGFAGWDFFRFRDLTVSAEVGASYAGDFEHDLGWKESFSGPYVNVLAKYPLSNKVWVQGRVGPNLISGLSSEMFGAGFGFHLTEAVALRTEIVRYGNVDSLRLEAVVSF